jgi:hypothetical protein
MKLLTEKKGVISVLTWWVEMVAFIVLVVGFVFSIFIRSAFVTYIVITLFGLLAGRFIYYKRHGFPFYLITMGLLIGYVLGSRYGQWKLIIVLFFLGGAVSYYVHQQGYLDNI